MSTKEIPTASTPSRKEYKKELYTKLETSLQDFKNTVGEKRFNRRLKKATKVLVHGLHNKDLFVSKNGSDKTSGVTTKKIKLAKKANSKKALPKKVKQSEKSVTSLSEN